MEYRQDAIFLIEGENLIELAKTPYQLEEDFQAQLANHPQLLGGGQYPGMPARRWLLVDREVSVPDKQDGPGRWSVDHVFVDQDAVPTIVEVKRATDTRLRREMVGQMLDYAANGSRYWPGELLRGRWEASLPPEQDPGVEIQSFAGVDVEEFWDKVSTNLKEGQVRMLFVSDDIPTELQTVIEYLNEQMEQVEVLGISISRYAGAGVSVLVPRVVGSSARVQQAKQAGTGKSYDEYVEDVGDEAAEMERRIIELAVERGLGIRKSRTALILQGDTNNQGLLWFYPGFRTVQLPLDSLRNSKQGALAAEVFDELSSISSRELTEKYPGIPLTDALDNWTQIKDILLRLASAPRT